MREIVHPDSSGPLYAKPWFGVLVGLVCLLAGAVIGGAFFPQQVVKLVTVEKRVEVPVERIVEKQVPVEVIKYVDRVGEKRVEVPVNRVLENRVEVPVEVVKLSAAARDLASWRELSVGMSPASVRKLLGTPVRGAGSEYFHLVKWYYDDNSWVDFVDGKLHDWAHRPR